ncbi:ketopantoate reductase family protein [Geomicrobium sp. JSM 1781026]|uniref:ketopantoate reductase family protein n=1 Tax=Geomicrobium sp. JSM 1781026 TaxID=3344580 RepID=UPI0035C254FE
MKILVVGAGAVGGYFGARLHEAGQQVTFLVRPKRRVQLQENGLIVKSRNGDLNISHPHLITTADVGSFDVVLMSTKSYHLHDAIEDVLPFVHSETIIIPLLNGVQHLDVLDSAFSKTQVYGGVAFIESTLSEDGHILHQGANASMMYGHRSHAAPPSATQVEKALSSVSDIKSRENIESDMWQKYMLITILSGATTLFHTDVGTIRTSTSAGAFIDRYINEVARLIERIAPEMDAERLQQKAFRQWQNLDASFKASMQKDKEKGQAVEYEHIQGYLLDKAKAYHLDAPALEVVYANLELYEQKRKGDFQ